MQSWTDEQVEHLIENYQTVDNKDIAKVLNKTEPSISHKANRLGLKRDKSNIRKYHFNEYYFDSLTKSGAYILGYTMADGCVNTNKKNHYRISYHINPKDIEILDFIKQELNLTQNYRFCRTLNKKTNKIYESVQLQFSSKVIYNQLQKYGIVNRKTGFESLDKIPKEFQIDFILGYFDGDGSCLKNAKTGQFTFNIVSASKKYLDSIQQVLNKGKVINHSSIYKLNITGIKNIAEVGNMLYNNAGFCLSRKKKIMLEVIERVNNV